VKLRRSLAIALGLLAAVLCVGTIGYQVVEGWRFLDALWMVTITLTTIGFGEIHPLSDLGRIFTMGLIVAGVSVGTYAMSALTAEIIEGDFAAAMKRRRRERAMSQLNDHYIVVGAGRLGATIVGELLDSGVKVVVVDREPGSLRTMEERGLPVVAGDGSHDDVLRAAGIERARGVAVAVDDPASAVFVTLSARELNPKLNIITRIDDGENSLKARRAGASSVVSPHTMGGWRMAHGLIRPNATSFLDLALLSAYEDILLDEFAVADGSSAVGKSLADLRFSEHHAVLVVAIRRRDGTLVSVPRGDHRLAAGDVLIVIGAPQGVRALAESMAVEE
jgi:voltage-gated potassium channel